MFGHKNKIITDEKLIDELLTRGVHEVIFKDDLKKKLMSGRELRIKLGIDPTSPNLHLGRSVPLLKLRDFQKLGHKIVFILGDFTAVIGDTSDKDSERPMLTEKQIKENMKNYKAQVGKILDLSRCEFLRNSSWLKDLNYNQIGEHANLFSINQFISRENIDRRLKEGKRVSLREVLYPLMQGYDSVAVRSDVELGGTDQKFNLLTGRDLQKHFGQVEQNIVMFPLIEGLDGRKMSSSFGNTVNFLDNPKDMYGKAMSLRDEFIIQYFVLMTRTPLSLVEDLKQEVLVKPKEVKMKLAFEIVKMYHSEKEAKKAEESFVQTFQKKEIPDNIEEITGEGSLGALLVLKKVVASMSEWRRLVDEGAIKKLNDKAEEKITDLKIVATPGVYKIGKRRFIKIK